MRLVVRAPFEAPQKESPCCIKHTIGSAEHGGICEMVLLISVIVKADGFGWWTTRCRHATLIVCVVMPKGKMLTDSFDPWRWCVGCLRSFALLREQRCTLLLNRRA